jgi:hypothetical protein
MDRGQGTVIIPPNEESIVVRRNTRAGVEHTDEAAPRRP